MTQIHCVQLVQRPPSHLVLLHVIYIHLHCVQRLVTVARHLACVRKTVVNESFHVLGEKRLGASQTPLLHGKVQLFECFAPYRKRVRELRVPLGEA